MPLYIAATEAEAKYLDKPVLISGIGTLAAAITLCKELSRSTPDRVINFGTAGALAPISGEFEINEVIKHDFDTETLKAITGLDIPNRITLEPITDLPQARLATGDSFIGSNQQRQALQTRADLCDMEGYAIAAVCAAYEVPCTLIKQVSDNADEQAARTWAQAVELGAQRLADVIDKL
ncbi:nucleosidase [Corynebacterium pelargi]|nr:nucleosidase [Corynebacterium pelargi]